MGGRTVQQDIGGNAYKQARFSYFGSCCPVTLVSTFADLVLCRRFLYLPEVGQFWLFPGVLVMEYFKGKTLEM